MPAGRPSFFTEKLADEICELIAGGATTREIAQLEHMPNRCTIIAWGLGHAKAAKEAGFPERYQAALVARCEVWAEDTIAIADDNEADSYTDDEGRVQWNFDHINRARLRITSRQWYASKIARSRFGDKVTQEITGEGGGPIVAVIRES
jgi:hypothetical protein